MILPKDFLWLESISVYVSELNLSRGVDYMPAFVPSNLNLLLLVSFVSSEDFLECSVPRAVLRVRMLWKAGIEVYVLFCCFQL